MSKNILSKQAQIQMKPREIKIVIDHESNE